MKSLLRAGLAVLTLLPVPGAAAGASAPAGDQPGAGPSYSAAELAAAEPIAASLRQELADRMAAWKEIVFREPLAADPVHAKHGARWAELESAVPALRHPGDIARVRWAFQKLLDDALKSRFGADKRAGAADGKLGRWRETAAIRVDVRAAEIAATRAAASRVERVAAAVPPLAAEPTVKLGAFFDGTVPLPESAPPPPVAAPTPAPAPPPAKTEPPIIAGKPVMIVTLARPPVLPAPLRLPPPSPRGACAPDRAIVGNRRDPRYYGEIRRVLVCRGLPENAVAAALAEAEREKFDPLLLLAVTQTESGFDEDAVSKKKAMGLMQMKVRTAAQYNPEIARRPNLLFIPSVIYDVSVEHLRRLADRFAGGDDLQQFNARRHRRLLASWNAGEGNVLKHGGVPPFPETVNFIDRVNRNYARLAGWLSGD